MSLLLAALGAALGAPARFLLGHAWDRPRFAAGTFTANLLGSLFLGYFAARGLDGHQLALLGAGFCGGLTTYSAFAVKTHEHGWGEGLVYAAATILLALAACAAGFAVGVAQP